MSYVTNFYKAKEHDYQAFFAKYEDTNDISQIKAELNSLLKQIREKTNTYTFLLNKRYNVMYTPLAEDIVLSYTNRDGATFYFDTSNGFATSDSTDCIEISLDTKSGKVSYVTGYCYELGSVLIKTYAYNIATNNSRISLKLLYETIIPMLEEGTYQLNQNSTTFNASPYTDFCTSSVLNRMNATDFIRNFYGIDKTFAFSLGDMKRYVQSNKSFEIIVRTCDDEALMSELLSYPTERAVPLNELVGTSKADWKYAQELGVLVEFVQFKKRLKIDDVYSSERFKKTLAKTDKEWIEFIEKVKHWEEDLRFYTISYRANLLNTLVRGYLGGEYPFYYNGLSQHYPFGKFCNYVVEESINQGYTAVDTFIKTLADYIRMCDDLGVTPTLYSGYLHQTHDIIARNHKIKLRAEQEVIFTKRYEKFKPYKDEEYTVVAPINSMDLQKEGDTLNHCVASYIKRVVDNECLILFLRKTLTPSESLITLEIRNNSIVQARGLHNRQITEKERSALIKFAKQKEYTVRV